MFNYHPSPEVKLLKLKKIYIFIDPGFFTEFKFLQTFNGGNLIFFVTTKIIIQNREFYVS